MSLVLFAFSCCPVGFMWSLLKNFYFTCPLCQVLDDNVKAKLAQFCHVPVIWHKIWRFWFWLSQKPYIYSENKLLYLQLSNIVDLHDVPNIWHIPLLLKVSNSVVFWKLLSVAFLYDWRNFIFLFFSLFILWLKMLNCNFFLG